MANPFLYKIISPTFLFQAFQFCQTVLFQTIQFSISMQLSFIYPIERSLSGAISSGRSGLESDGNEEVFCIPQSSSITGTSLSDCLVSYPGYSFGGGGLTSLRRYSRCILQPPQNQVRNEHVPNTFVVNGILLIVLSIVSEKKITIS